MGTFQGLRGLKAKATIAKDEEMIFIPRSLVLWTTASSRCPFPEWIDASYYKRASWSTKLALMLLHEKRLAGESALAGYVAALPESVSVPYFWSSKELAALGSPYVRAQVREQQQTWAGWHRDLMEASPGCQVSRADFDWALSCVFSRAFKGPYIGSTIQDRLNVLLLVAGAAALSLTFGLFPEERVVNAAICAVLFNFLYELFLSDKRQQHVLAGVVDYANHSCAVDSEVSYNYFRDGYTVLAGRQFNAGEQVYISYGRQTSDSLLQYYGFVEEGNTADVYTFVDVLGALVELGAVAADQATALAGTGDAAVAAALDKVTMNDKAQLREEAKAALRFVLGLAPTVEAAKDKQSNQKDLVMWQAVLAVAQAERSALGGPAKGDRAEQQQAVRLGDGPRAVACQYNAVKKTYLEARIEQLQKRTVLMSK